MTKKIKTALYVVLCAVVACGAPPADDHIDVEISHLGQAKLAVTAKHKITLHAIGLSHLCVAAEGGKSDDGTKIVLAACDDSESQVWARFDGELRGVGDKCINVEHGDTNGSDLVLGPCDSQGGKSAWTLQGKTMRFGESKMRCADIVDSKYEPGTKLQLWMCADNDVAQQFGWAWSLDDFDSAPNEHAEAKFVAPHEQKPPEQHQQPQHPQNPAQHPLQSHPADPGKVQPTPQPAQPAQSHSGAMGPAPEGILVAPYFYAWDSPGCIQWLNDAKAKAGLKHATLAFGLSDNGCGIKGFADYVNDGKKFIAAGGSLVLSFGGQAGTYVQTTCKDSAKIAAALTAQAAQFNTKFLDFDVEGANLHDQAANQRLAAALAIVQKQHAEMYISFTLPVDPDAGLPGEAVQLLNAIAKAGVKPSRINIMAMDYGRHPKAGQTVGDLAISAANATAKQMAKVWPKATKAEIYHAIGITPMIGQNDGHQDSPFMPSDAQKVAQWAKANGIGHLAYWAFQRDVAKSGDYNDHSNSQKQDYEFYKAFASVGF